MIVRNHGLLFNHLFLYLGVLLCLLALSIPIDAAKKKLLKKLKKELGYDLDAAIDIIQVISKIIHRSI